MFCSMSDYFAPPTASFSGPVGGIVVTLNCEPEEASSLYHFIISLAIGLKSFHILEIGFDLVALEAYA